MKTKHTFIKIIIGCTLFLGACKDVLEEQPESFLNIPQFYQNENQVVAALNGCYTPLNSIYNTGLMIANEGATDLAYLNNVSQYEAIFEISPAMPGMGSGLWTNCYKGIMYCNAVIAGIDRLDILEQRKQELKAEGVVLRAMYYYILTSTFNDVPFYRDDVTSLEVLNRVAKLPRMSAVDTRNSLVTELNKYVAYLPQVRTSQVPLNRVSSSVAYMLIAKMAIWNKEYQTALNALLEIQKIYGALNQYPLTDTWFRNKNTPESILEIQFIWSATGLKKTSGVAANFTPPRSTNSVYDGVTIPELGNKSNPYVSLTPSDFFVSLYHEDDPRRNMVLGFHYNGTYFNRPKSNNYMGKPWMGPKFWCPGMDNVSDGNNQKVFRYADALLLIAECAVELLSPDIDLAMKSLNEVKARALPSSVLTQYPGKEVFLLELKAERARELMGEYQRKWDLVRWGEFYERVKETTAKEFNLIDRNIRPYHEYYPISDSEVVRSEGILDNKEYTGY